jgi:hypothetical protein
MAMMVAIIAAAVNVDCSQVKNQNGQNARPAMRRIWRRNNMMSLLSDSLGEMREEDNQMRIEHALLQAAAMLRATMNFTTDEAVVEAIRLRNRIREIEI